MNLTNGDGRDSLVQKYTGPVDDTHYGNTNEGVSSIVSGDSNYNNAKRAILAGKLNKNEAPNVIVVGNSNVLSETAEHSINGGGRNFNSGASSKLTGYGNQNLGRNSDVGGHTNINYASEAIVGGLGNINGDPTDSEKGVRSIIIGLENLNTGESAMVGGFGNVNDVDDAIVGGYYAKANGSLFRIGNGSRESKSNAIEVFRDGSARVSRNTLESDPDNTLVTKGSIPSLLKIATEQEIKGLFR